MEIHNLQKVVSVLSHFKPIQKKKMFFIVAGPPLPKGLAAHEMVSTGYDLIVIGGWDSGINSSGSIYKLSCSNHVCEWETLVAQLKVPRFWFTHKPRTLR